MRQDDTLVLKRILEPTESVRELIGALDAELAANYPSENRHGLQLDAIFQPHIRFFVAWRNGVPAGCGGVALFQEFAELKRMYVVPEFRSKGVADALITQLQHEARVAGIIDVKLETGTEQHAAIAFYRRQGFQFCAAFEPYASMPREAIIASVFMEKSLAAE